MSVTKSSREWRVDSKGVLSAECRKRDGTWTTSSVDLDQHLGNIDAKFVPGASGFSRSGRSVRISSGPIISLCAELQERDDPWSWYEDSIDLDLIVENIDGTMCINFGAIESAACSVVRADTALNILKTSVAETALAQTVTTLQSRERAMQAIQDVTLRSLIDLARKGNLGLLNELKCSQQRLMTSQIATQRSILALEASKLRDAFAAANMRWNDVHAVASRTCEALREFQDLAIGGAIKALKTAREDFIRSLSQAEINEVAYEEIIEELESRIERDNAAIGAARQGAATSKEKGIGFIVGSIFLPFIFVPLTLRAQDEERNFRSIEVSHLETLRSRNASKLSYLLALRTLKHFRETSDDKLKEYEALQSSIGATHIHLLEFEKYIQQLQERLTALSQAFGECEAKTVTRLEFSSTISDGIRILQEAESMSRRATEGFGASSLLLLE